jgi:hypothetical protein
VQFCVSVLWWQKKISHKNTKTRKPTKTIFVGPFGAILCLRALVAKKKETAAQAQNITQLFFYLMPDIILGTQELFVIPANLS